VQIIYDEFTQSVRLLATTPSTTVKITKNMQPRCVSKGGGATRGISAKKPRAGTSSEGAEREMSDKNGEGVVSYVFPLKQVPGEEGEVELVCDGVLKAGGMSALFQRLADDKLATVPSFCPIPSLDSISTNIKVDCEQDEGRKTVFLEMCEANGVAVGSEGGFCTMLNVDAGKEKLFRGIAESLQICGFGERSEKWDWHVVVLRRARSFLTLYILVVHAPYPGMWVIVEREHIGASVADCEQSYMMVGEDMAPYSEFNNGVFTVKRGLWEPSFMHLYLGFSSMSFALDRCLNTNAEDAGLAVSGCVDCGFLTMADVKKGFIAQKKRITAKYAQEDLVCNNTFVEKMTAEHKSDEQHNPALSGTVIDLAQYGSLRVVVKEHEDKDDEEGAVTHLVTVHDKELRFRVHAEQLIKIHMFHTINSHKDAIDTVLAMQLVYIGQHGDEDAETNALVWAPGYWEFETPYPLQFDSDEEANYWVIRRGSEEVLKIRVDRV